MLVVAFDGVLFDTFPLRARAIVEAFAAQGTTVDLELVLAMLPSRSIGEAVLDIALPLARNNATAGEMPLDATALELVTLRAERAEADIASHGAPLNVALRDRLRRSAMVTRIVLRSDSTRQVAERLLTLAELDDIISFTRSADDLPNPPAGGIRMSSTERSYAHIVKRLAANASLLGESSSIGVALEYSGIAQRVARECGFETPDHPCPFRVG